MISLVELSVFSRSQGKPMWGDVREGDGVSYADGSLYIVDKRALDDGKQVTFIMRCVVPPADIDYRYGNIMFLSVENNAPLPDGVTHSSGERRDVR